MCLMATGHVDFTIKPIGDDGDIVELSWAKVFIGDVEVDLASCSKIDGISIRLEFDKQYKIQLQSKYYETLEIKFNTFVSAADKGYNYTNSFSPSMIKRKPGSDVKYTIVPNIEYKLDVSKGDFINKNTYNPQFTYQPIKPKIKDTPVPTEAIGVDNPVSEEEPVVVEKEQVAPKETAKPEDLVEESKTEEKPEEKKEETIVKKPVTIPVEPVVNLDPKKQEILNEIKPEALERNRASKSRLVEMYDEMNKSEETLIMDRETQAKSKRQFLEEISDGGIELKKTERNYK